MGSSAWKFARQFALLGGLIDIVVSLRELLTRPDANVMVETIGEVVSLHSIYLGLAIAGIVVVFMAVFPSERGFWAWVLWKATQHRRKKRFARAQIEDAYLKLRAFCEPETLNPNHPGNPLYMKAEARDASNLLRPLLVDLNFSPPPLCTDDNLPAWFNYLGTLRAADCWANVLYDLSIQKTPIGT